MYRRIDKISRSAYITKRKIDNLGHDQLSHRIKATQDRDEFYSASSSDADTDTTVSKEELLVMPPDDTESCRHHKKNASSEIPSPLLREFEKLSSDINETHTNEADCNNVLTHSASKSNVGDQDLDDSGGDEIVFSPRQLVELPAGRSTVKSERQSELSEHMSECDDDDIVEEEYEIISYTGRDNCWDGNPPVTSPVATQLTSSNGNESCNTAVLTSHLSSPIEATAVEYDFSTGSWILG